MTPRSASFGGTEIGLITTPVAWLACHAIAATSSAAATPAAAVSTFSANPARSDAICHRISRRWSLSSPDASPPGARPDASASMAISIGSGVVGAATGRTRRRFGVVPPSAIRAAPRLASTVFDAGRPVKTRRMR